MPGHDSVFPGTTLPECLARNTTMAPYLPLLTGLFLCCAGLSGWADDGMPARGEQPAVDQQAEAYPPWMRGWTVRHPTMVMNDRLTQRRREIEAARTQRELELEAARKAREADREAWLQRWDEQRERAREASLERERSYREELSRRFPGLETYRQRYAEELENRWAEIEQRRKERWRQSDLAENP
jgi:hypothetical protein